jgi:AcrR family transcriptional regulator
MAAEETRTQLVAAAERLFAEKGVDAVSLREITRASGAKNTIALQYHFGDRAGVLAAVVAKHRPAVEERRAALLDEYEAQGRPDDLRQLAAALVRPLAAKLGDPDGGRPFLQVYADLWNRPAPLVADAASGTLQRWRELVEPLLPEDAAELHRRFTAILHCATELGRRAAQEPADDERLFTSYLVDVVTAILGAPVSEETRRLLAERKASGRGRRRASAAAR